jgi:hypothetical protein
VRCNIETDPTRPEYSITQRGAGYIFSAIVEVVY